MVIELSEALIPTIGEFLGKLLKAVVLLFLGWIIGTVIGKITREILRRIRVDEYISGGKKPLFKISDIFGTLFAWGIYLMFIQSAVYAVEITPLVDAIGAILAFLPKLAEAIIVVIAGYAVAEYVRTQVKQAKLTYANEIGGFLFFMILYVAVATALPLLGIEAFLINALLISFIGSLSVGFAIALGFGLKDVVAQWAKKKMKTK